MRRADGASWKRRIFTGSTALDSSVMKGLGSYLIMVNTDRSSSAAAGAGGAGAPSCSISVMSAIAEWDTPPLQDTNMYLDIKIL